MNTTTASSTRPPLDLRMVQRLTTINVLWPLLVVAAFVTLGLTRARALDLLAPVLFWSWAALGPILDVLAIRLAKRLSAKRLLRVNVAALICWGVALLGLLLVH